MKPTQSGSPTPTRVDLGTRRDIAPAPPHRLEISTSYQSMCTFPSPGEGQSITVVSIPIRRRTNNSVGEIRMQVWSEAEGGGPGALLSSSQPVLVTSLPAVEEAFARSNFAFAPEVPLAGARWVILHWSNDPDIGDHTLEVQTNASGDATLARSTNGTSWEAMLEQNDPAVRVYGSPPD